MGSADRGTAALVFIADGDILHAPQGAFVFVARGTSHCFQNTHRHRADAGDVHPIRHDYETVVATPAKDVATVTSFRMPPGELEQTRHAARTDGVTISEWIRSACKTALGRPASMPDRAHIIELLDVLRRTVEEADRTVKAQSAQHTRPRR